VDAVCPGRLGTEGVYPQAAMMAWCVTWSFCFLPGTVVEFELMESMHLSLASVDWARCCVLAALGLWDSWSSDCWTDDGMQRTAA
jgi:hypothetical protein